MSDRSRGYALRLEVAASAAQVWHGLTDSATLGAWYAESARVDRRVGGIHRVRLAGGREREAHIDVYQPPSRLRLIYLPSPEMPAPDGVVVDDFILDERNGVTHLCLLGSGFPRDLAHAEFLRDMRDGWTRALSRLKILSERKTGGAR